MCDLSYALGPVLERQVRLGNPQTTEHSQLELVVYASSYIILILCPSKIS